MNRSPLKRGKPLRSRPRRKPGTDRGAAGFWRRAVLRRDKCCVLCGARDELEAHHILGASILRNELAKYGDGTVRRFLYCVANGLTLCSPCHQSVTARVRRVPRSVLPAGVGAFCGELDALTGTSWASVRLEREVA